MYIRVPNVCCPDAQALGISPTDNYVADLKLRHRLDASLGYVDVDQWLAIVHRALRESSGHKEARRACDEDSADLSGPSDADIRAVQAEEGGLYGKQSCIHPPCPTGN
jgi:hypothetical protein